MTEQQAHEEQEKPSRAIGKMHVTVTLLLDGEEQTHEVLVIHPDKLRGEQAGARLKIGPMADAPMTYTTLWVWAACRRLKIVGTDVDPGRFLNEVCVDLVPEEDEEPADPTRPDPAGI